METVSAARYRQHNFLERRLYGVHSSGCPAACTSASRWPLYQLGFLLIIVLLLFGSTRPAMAQGAVCTSGRYTNDLFSNVTQTQGILYGINSVRDYSQGTDTPVQLLLDFFQPTGDTQAQRPLIIFAFGGAFVSGQRSSMNDLCLAFAKKGFVTATIDYRLVPAGPNGVNYSLVFGSSSRFSDQLVRASSDLKAAIRFFRRDAATANIYKIDPTKIFVAGYSAGAVMALQTAYIGTASEDTNFINAYSANGGIEGNTDLPSPNNALPGYNSNNLAGVLSLAGGLPNVNVLNTNDPALFAAHGDNDATVPYNSGPAFGSSPYMLYGSKALNTRAISVGVQTQLYTVAGGNHSVTRQEPDMSAITNSAATFFQQILCPAPLPVTLSSFSASLDSYGKITASWTTASERDNSHFILQLSKDGRIWRDLLRKDAANNAAAGASYFAETDLNSLGLAGFGLLGIFLLPLTQRRYRLWASIAVFAMFAISCAKVDHGDTQDFGGNHKAKAVTYLRLAQYDRDGKVSYSQTLAVRPGI